MRTEIPLWPDDALVKIAARGDVPTLHMLAPHPERATGAAVIVFPGGGYVVHAEHEAEPIAEWLAAHGITAFVLRYRLHPQHKHPSSLHDAARAVRVVRANASQWGIDPARIGVLGFSAGGHLASMLSTHFDDAPAKDDDRAATSARPDLQVLIYPVISLQGEEGHAWCAEALFGPNPAPALTAQFSSHMHVTPATPPAFLMHTADDSVSWLNSMLMAQALGHAGVPFELHVYERGGHGYGLAENDPLLASWPERCIAWLRAHDFAAPAQQDDGPSNMLVQ